MTLDLNFVHEATGREFSLFWQECDYAAADAAGSLETDSRCLLMPFYLMLRMVSIRPRIIAPEPSSSSDPHRDGAVQAER